VAPNAMTSTLKSAFSELLSPILESDGIEFVDVETEKVGTGKTVRLLIHKPGGVTVADCRYVSRIVRPILEIQGLIKDSTHLEVASPGLDRPLVTEADFRRNIGQKIQVEVLSSTGKPSQASGVLKEVETGKILLAGQRDVQIEISKIKKAQIQLMW
jgi:ribosome maturation factor RimP